MEVEDADRMNEASDLDDTVLNVAGVIGCTPTGRSKKRKKKQVQPSTDDEKARNNKKKKFQSSNEELDEITRHKGLKKRREEAHDTIIMSPDRNISEGGNITKDQEIVHGTEGQELNAPVDSSWVQKASWKSLVGETGRVAFSLGGLLGQNTSNNARAAIEGLGGYAKRSNVSACIDGESGFAPSFGTLCDPPQVLLTKDSITKPQTKKVPQSVSLQVVGKNHAIEGTLEDVATSTRHFVESPDLKKFPQNEDGGEERVCTFMRSDSYEQEWLEAKRAVKEIYKRSRKDAIRSMKMFHTKQKA